MSAERPKLPNEAIELYNSYIHGEINRRDFLNGVSRFAVAGLTVGSIVDALMPDYAAAQQVSKTDDRIKASYVTVPSPQGNGSIKAYLVRPNSADTSDPACEKRKTLSTKRSTSWFFSSRKYSVMESAESATRRRAPGGSFIWP